LKGEGQKETFKNPESKSRFWSRQGDLGLGTIVKSIHLVNILRERQHAIEEGVSPSREEGLEKRLGKKQGALRGEF